MNVVRKESGLLNRVICWASLVATLTTCAAASSPRQVHPVANTQGLPMMASQSADGIDVQCQGRLLLRYATRNDGVGSGADVRYARGGYLAAVYAPSGRLLTDDFPPDHPHHHGVWFAWTKTMLSGRTPDFWNLGKETADVVLDKTELHVGRPGDPVRFRTWLRHIDQTGKDPIVVLEEEQIWNVHPPQRSQDDGPFFYIVDVLSQQKNVVSHPLVLTPHHYGGFGLRGHRAWRNATEVTFTTSGRLGRIEGNESRPLWTDMSGTVDGTIVGVAVLDHPDNARHPTPVRIHPEEPYLSLAPPQLGSFSIEPGGTYTMRVRLVVHDDVMSLETLDQIWRTYAEPTKHPSM